MENIFIALSSSSFGFFVVLLGNVGLVRSGLVATEGLEPSFGGFIDGFRVLGFL